MANEVSIIVKATDQASSVLSGIGGAMKTMGAVALGVAAAGIGGLTAAIVGGIAASIEAEEAQSQLNAVLKSTGGIAGVTAEQANSLADKFEGLTKFTAEATLAGESILLTFTGIGKEVFPQVTETMLDMSQALGVSTTGAATMLGKALNDPIKGLTALTRVGVVFTDEQKKMVEELQNSGDLIGAQNVLLQELQTEYGGSARAAGETFAGKLEILKNKFGAIQESIGGAFLPLLTQLADSLTSALSSPEIQAGADALVAWLGTSIPIAVQYLTDLWNNTLLPAIQAAGEWIAENLVPVLQELWIWFQEFLPVAIAYLSELWTNTLLPAITEVWEWIQINLLPLLASLVSWLQEYLPIAIEALVTWWTNTLMPALSSAWDWMQTYLVPILAIIVDWLQDYLPVAIDVLVAYWTNILLPTMTLVWDWISTVLIPLLEDLSIWLQENLPGALQALTDFLQNVVIPALEEFHDFIKDDVTPGLEALGGGIDLLVDTSMSSFSAYITETIIPGLMAWIGAIDEYILPGLEALGGGINLLLDTALAALAGAIDGIKAALGGLILLIDAVIEAFANLEIPDWFTPGSPTPLEIGIRGINDELKYTPHLVKGLSDEFTKLDESGGNIAKVVRDLEGIDLPRFPASDRETIGLPGLPGIPSLIEDIIEPIKNKVTSPKTTASGNKDVVTAITSMSDRLSDYLSGILDNTAGKRGGMDELIPTPGGGFAGERDIAIANALAGGLQ